MAVTIAGIDPGREGNFVCVCGGGGGGLASLNLLCMIQ